MCHLAVDLTTINETKERIQNCLNHKVISDLLDKVESATRIIYPLCTNLAICTTNLEKLHTNFKIKDIKM